MIDALRTPPAFRRPGPDRAPLDFETCRAKALGLSVAYSRRLTGLDVDTAAACAQLTPGELATIEDGTATPAPTRSSGWPTSTGPTPPSCSRTPCGSPAGSSTTAGGPAGSPPARLPAPTGPAVSPSSSHRQGFPDDVRVPGVLGGLGDDVQEGAPRAPHLAGLEPRRRRQRLGGIEVGQRRHQLVGAGGHLLVPGQQPGERLRLGDPVPVGPGRHLRRRLSQSTLAQSTSAAGAGPSTTKSAQDRSVPATCLISPPRVSSLTVVRAGPAHR